MKFVYYNDTKRMVSIHPATLTHGCDVDMKVISPLEERVFALPQGTYPWVKMWDYGEKGGLQILVSPRSEAEDDYINFDTPSESEINNFFEEHPSIRKIFKNLDSHDKNESKFHKKG